MSVDDCEIVIIASAPEATVTLCGVPMLERLLRVLQRIGARKVTVVSSTPEEIRNQVSEPSWARADLTINVEADDNHHIRSNRTRTLLLSCSWFDPRLLESLLRQRQPTALVDSKPPPELQPLVIQQPRVRNATWCGAAIVVDESLSVSPANALFVTLRTRAEQNQIAVLDVDDVATYVVGMRRHLRPLCFPPPQPAQLARAENLLLDLAQNGTLDIPALVHAPIETWIIRRLCRTSITPIQITLSTACISLCVTMCFATGHLVIGTVLALVVGVLDGLDGKQARVKVETTELGKREHVLDYVLELSWWVALAFHFATTSLARHAYVYFALLVSADLIDQLARRVVKKRVGRNLDDVAPFDRCVRLIGGRRNIYIWMLAVGLLLRIPDKAFIALCCWGGMTAAIHVGRALWISGHGSARAKGIAH